MSKLVSASTVLALLLSSCAGTCREPTQVLVVIDAEDGVRAQAAEMRIVVQSAPDAEPAYERTLNAARGELVLPFVLALVPKDGDASRRFEVAATVVDADAEFVAQVRALSGYVPNRKLLLRLMLEDSCAGVECEDVEKTCVSGSCESAIVDPQSLEPLDDDSLPDASTVAAGEPGGDGGVAGSGMSGNGASGSGGSSVTAGRSGSGGNGGTGGRSGSGGTSGQGGTAGSSGGCDDGDERLCGNSTGECSPGLQICAGGDWSTCMGATLGGAEQCDLQDDDCDDDIDEDAVCNPGDLAHTTQASCWLGSCRASECEATWGDCNTSRQDGCEQTLTTLEHCGDCDEGCAIANAGESCASGSCLVTTCEPGWDDCDEDGTSCETPLGTMTDCNACGDSCTYANATGQCVGSGVSRSCALTACVSSRYDDCDDDESTGCEVDLQSSSANCGACDIDCSTQTNVQSATCDDGACVLDCNPGSIDCDGNASNGCEAATCANCFAAGASNFAPADYSYPAAVAFNCGGTHIFDSTTQTWNTSCCGTCPSVSGPDAQTGAGGPQVVILRAASLTVAAGTTVRLVGQYPVVIAVRGSATIAGTIDASANGTTPGAGGNSSCGASAGGNAVGGFALTGGCGGGGGGFGSAGGAGGAGNYGTAGGAGAARGTAALSPLIGGCGGGLGGGCMDAPGGAGGGAFQLSVADTLTATGTFSADGGAGTAGCNYGGGGSGGGSGGAILLEATVLNIGGATLRTRGGIGGMGANGGSGGPGSTNAMATGSAGGDDPDEDNGGGGGGGGYGRIRTRLCPGP